MRFAKNFVATEISGIVHSERSVSVTLTLSISGK
jgi:hypothetical protein